MTSTAASRKATARNQPPHRRMPRAERVTAMLDLAAPVLANEGFAVSTRTLAAALGVTQALIYKHFSSKEAFIAEVLAHAFGKERRDPAILRDESVPLAERLVAFYAGGAGGGNGDRLRLFVRAALEGWPVPVRRGTELTRSVFEPVVSALRKEAGLPSIEERPLLRGERELAMMLHGSVVFLGIRKHVYRMPMPDDRDAIVRLHVDTFLAGAFTTLRQIHAGAAGESMTVEQLTPPLRSP